VTPFESAILLLSLAFFIPLGFAYLINKYPDLVAKGQDAAGRGMAIGCVSILLMAVSAVLALAAAITVGAAGPRASLPWRIVGVLPLVGSLIAGFVVFLKIQMAKSRRIAREHQQAMSVPAALIVDDDDSRTSRLYNAIRPSFPTLEISLRHPGALYWQQQEWFPRLRLLMLSAEAMLVTEGQTGELTQDLLNAMCRAKPACPIVLHALSAAAAESITARLSKAGWIVHPVLAEGEDWIAARWRGIAAGVLKGELAKRPEYPEAPT
jgi:MFS family permease